MKTGIELITEERKRQVESEGWTAQHDSHHIQDEMAIVAALYATPLSFSKMMTRIDVGDVSGGRGDCPVWGELRYTVPTMYPLSWHPCWWSPGDHDGNPDRVRDLVKAGALIAAEIDRLLAASGEAT